MLLEKSYLHMFTVFQAFHENLSRKLVKFSATKHTNSLGFGKEKQNTDKQILVKLALLVGLKSSEAVASVSTDQAQSSLQIPTP